MSLDTEEALPEERDFLPAGPASRLELALSTLGHASGVKRPDLSRLPQSARQHVRGDWIPVKCLLGVLQHRDELMELLDEMSEQLLSAQSLTRARRLRPNLSVPHLTGAVSRRLLRLHRVRKLLKAALRSARRELDTVRREVQP